jgi:hypothetical protein
MATRPLDAAFGGSTTKKSKKRGAILAVGIVAGLASIGSIFAATVTINSPADPGISFAQGTTTIAACDDDIQASLGAYYNNDATNFALDAITLTDVNSDCTNQELTLELWSASAKLVTVTGTIPPGGNVNIGSGGVSLPAGPLSGTNLDGSPSVTYESEVDAVDLAGTATRIVIEIN